MAKIVMAIMILIPTWAMALAPVGGWQVREVTCSNNQPGKFPVDHQTFKYLFNLDSDFTYDVVVINKSHWSNTRGVARVTDTQICFNAKEAWAREKAFWQGSALHGCWDYQNADHDKLVISFVARSEGQDCDKGQTVFVGFEKVN